MTEEQTTELFYNLLLRWLNGLSNPLDIDALKDEARSDRDSAMEKFQ